MARDLNPSKPYKKTTDRVKGYGPAMSACTPWQRKYVEARYHYPELPPYKAVQHLHPNRYVGKYDAARKMGQRLDTNPMVQAAILEYGQSTYASKLPKVIDALDKVIDNPKAKDRVKVLHGLLDRVGMHTVSETKATVTHTFDREQAIRAIASIIERHQGLLPKVTAALPVIRDAVLQPPLAEAGEAIRSASAEAPDESD